MVKARRSVAHTANVYEINTTLVMSSFLHTDPVFMSSINDFLEVDDAALGVRILEEDAAHVLAREVHLREKEQLTVNPIFSFLTLLTSSTTSMVMPKGEALVATQDIV